MSMHTYVQSTTGRGQKAKLAQTLIYRWVGKEMVVYLCNGIFFSHEKEMEYDTCHNPWKHYKWKKLDTECHMYSIYVKYIGNTGWRSPGAGLSDDRGTPT